ncbi:MFS transporter [Streptomyces sp. I6]|uniref:MFS transporter n=1 Tax=Streptomyces sp. I6 TaxID=2483113 RepID=UPI0028803A0A|nr:MFS transporter [Streptomyces sp. I6]
MPAIVPPAGRDRGNAALKGGSVVAGMVVGNPLGAVLYDVDPALPFTFDALSFAVAAALIGLLKGSFRTATEPGPRAPADVYRQAAAGFGLLWHQLLLRRIALLSALCNFVGAAQLAIGVLFVRHDLGLSASLYGALAAAYGLGSLVASLLEGRLVFLLGRGRILYAAMVAASAAALGIGLSDSGWVAGCFTAVYGASMTLWTVTVTTVRQDCVPLEYMGRVTMTHRTLVRAAATLGAAAGGLTAHALGLRSVFQIGSALLLAGVLAGGRGLLKASAP